MATNMPTGDVWELIDNDSNSQWYGKKFKFDFCYIRSESIKIVIKAYIWRNYREANKTLYWLYSESRSNFRKVNEFLSMNNITSLSGLTNNDIDNFLSYLKILINPKNKKVYSQSTQRNSLNTLKNIIRWGQLYMPNEVPKVEIFTGNEYIEVNRKLKIDFIPDEVLEKINKVLKNEENPYVKYGIIILQSTGMRIGDMLKLTTDCIKSHLISGYTLTWYDHKNRKERQPMPIPNECVIAVEKLIEYTKELRKQADDNVKDYLFILDIKKANAILNRIGEIDIITHHTFTWWLSKFIINNHIRDKNGELYNLTSHQFRRTLATDMLSKGNDINIIRNVLGHSNASVTDKHYADVKDKARAEVFRNVGIIGNINRVDETIITDKQELEWFNDNKYKGARMEDGYCTKPCKDGQICEKLLKRQKCYTCGRYITTPEYLQAHKNHLEELERQLEGNIYGDHYAVHFIPTIEILKEIVSRLEEIQDGNN